jgi:hypothetical protein
MLSSLIDPTLSAVNTMAVANFAAYATDFYPKQVQLRTILDGLGVVAIRYAMYEAYHGELYHLSKVASGSSAVAQATVLVTKYTTLGADVPTLKQIALDIYAITVP